MNRPSSPELGARTRVTLTAMAISALLATAAVLLWHDHRAHVVSILPYLFLAACPLLHLLSTTDTAVAARTRAVTTITPDTTAGGSLQ